MTNRLANLIEFFKGMMFGGAVFFAVGCADAPIKPDPERTMELAPKVSQKLSSPLSFVQNKLN